ncbi:MAG: long-chain fatty acid--CoA ligase, partial [Verrucomicrobia bacterium]|nr:long-chain fatty acid--CoA ligase [Verrucomicrobiota bacterium]
AVRDLGSGDSGTFEALGALADAAAATERRVVAQGHDVGFVVSVLRAWRSGGVLCPLESGQRLPEEPPPPEGTALLKRTSGTTGAPRSIRFTASQMTSDGDAIVTSMGLHPGQPNLGVISLAHSYGFANLILPLLLHGVPLYLVPSPLPEVLARCVRGCPEPALTLPAVPALWTTWLQADVIPAAVRLAISAGAPLPLALEEAVFQRHGLKLHNFLGASECGGIAYDPSSVPRTDGTLAGWPLHGVGVDSDAEGCLTVRGPAVGAGYWPEPDAPLLGGVYRARDRVELTPGGGVRLLGRAGDLINVAGRKLHPETVEAELLRHAGVRAALVLGVPEDSIRGDAVAAVVQADASVSDASLREFLAARLPAWQLPRIWHRVGRLEANTRGKISRAEWRARLSPPG